MSSSDPEPAEPAAEQESSGAEETKIGVNGQEIPLRALSPQQLQQLYQQVQIEINSLRNNLEHLQICNDRFRLSGETVEFLKTHCEKAPEERNKTHCEKAPEERKKMLVPLTSSVYVDGYVTRPNEVLLDVGAGYYCKKDVKAAGRFLNEKVDNIEKNQADVSVLLRKKQQTLEEVTEVLYKMQAAAGRMPGGEEQQAEGA